jgi:predicted RNA methylase
LKKVLTGSTISVLIVATAWLASHGDRTGQGEGDGALAGAGLAASTTVVPDRYVDPPAELYAWRRVEDLPRDLAQFKTVFWDPRDTESLRRLIRETSVVRGKKVLEIGAGTGLLSLCCLTAGAARAVATDVNPAAIANTVYNAKALGVRARLETRLVPLDRSEAFSVIAGRETFDLVISNPPWEDRRPVGIDQYALYDKGFVLMRSLLEGLADHLNPGGRALLAYGCVDAIETLGRLASEFDLAIQTHDDRSLGDLPEVFLPGMLLEVVPRRGTSPPVSGLPGYRVSRSPIRISENGRGPLHHPSRPVDILKGGLLGGSEARENDSWNLP